MNNHPQTQVLCIIPARGGSKRLPRKNIAFLAGKPLLAYAIDTAINSNIFHQVCVSSEDKEILDISRYYGAQIALERPSQLASDRAQVKDVCKYVLEYFYSEGLEYPEFAVLLPTSPLRTVDDIKSAYDIFKREQANYVLSLTPYSHPPQRAVWAPNGYIKPYFGAEYLKQTQLLDQLYRHDGAIIFAKTEVFLKEGEFYGTKAVPYYIPKERAIDIDCQLDLDWAEYLLSQTNII